jgi:hypothetical protein
MADRYWVGGTAAWDGTAGTKWALTSGGAGGQAVPTSADDVFFTDLSTGTCTIATGNTGARSINCTGFTGTLAGSAAISVSGGITLVAGMTYTYTGSLSVIGTGTLTSAGKTLGPVTINGSGITVTLGDNCTMGTTRACTLTAGTIDLAGFTLSTGSFVSSNSSARSIAFGSGNIALTSTSAATVVLDMATATNFTFTGTGGFTRSQAATATVQFGSSAGGATTNAPNLTVNAGSSTLTITFGSWFKNTNFASSLCQVTGTINIAGNLTLAAFGTYTSLTPSFRASGTITSVGKTLGSTTIDGSGITVTLADALALGTTIPLTLTQGTFTTSNFNVTAGSFVSSNSNARTVNMGSGTWTITGNGTSWNTATTTNLTLNQSTSTISMTSGSSKTFAGGGATYYNLNQGGLGTMTISGSNTFNNITNSVNFTRIVFTAGTTQTLSNFDFSGVAGQAVNISSSTPGSQYTLSKSSGTVNVQYLGIRDSSATGGAVWNAFTTNGNQDEGNNTGWLFSSGVGNMFLMF